MCHFCGRCQQRVLATDYCGCGVLGATHPLYDSNMGLGVDQIVDPSAGDETAPGDIF